MWCDSPWLVSIRSNVIRFGSILVLLDVGLVRFDSVWADYVLWDLIQFDSFWFRPAQCYLICCTLVIESAWANFYLVRFDSSLSQQIHFGVTPFVSRWSDSIRVECHRFDSGFIDVAWFGLIHIESRWFHFAHNGTLQCDVVRFVLIPCGSFSFDIR